MANLNSLREKLQPLKAIIVDDEKLILSKTHDFFENFFGHVDIFDNPLDALEKINKVNDYDVLFTDIIMPNMSGWDLIQQVKETNKNIFIGVLTAENKDHEKYKYLCDFYVNKPVMLEEMINMLELIAEKKNNDG